jgi:hypothetical protein
MSRRRIEMLQLFAAAILMSAPCETAAQTRVPRTRNVILVVTDGLRWQEVFNGADSLLIFGDAKALGGDTISTRRRFWRERVDERRQVLLPFIWGTVARRGQIFGNRAAGSNVNTANGLKFSYPGYNEMLTGFVDPRIDRNDYGPNPNMTVFSWLQQLPPYRGKVAAFATWDAFADIFAVRSSGVYVHAGWEPPGYLSRASSADTVLNRLYATTFRMWDNNAYDSFTQAVVLRHLPARLPRVVFIGYGETDEWAHAGRYDRTLSAARAVDQHLADLWSLVQRHPHYRDRTSLIITTDHGRGRTTSDWTNHGRTVDGAEEMWIAVMGPDTPAMGERMHVPAVTQSQIAATVAALLGLDYRRDVPQAAPPLPDLVRP